MHEWYDLIIHIEPLVCRARAGRSTKQIRITKIRNSKQYDLEDKTSFEIVILDFEIV